MIFESDLEVDLVNKLLGVVGDTIPNEQIMTKEEFVSVQDILRRSSASYINRLDRNVVLEGE